MPAKTFAPALAAYLLLAVLTAGLSSRGALAARAAAKKPNLIVILTDDQDLLLSSLDVMPQTRQLLGAQGATFSNYFVPTSLCCPSRATLLTGLYVHNHGVYQNFRPDGGFSRFSTLGHESRTVAVALDRAGYRTALMGKYLNEYPFGVEKTWVPEGWDEWIVPVTGSSYGGFNYTLNDNGVLVAHGATPADYLTDVLAQEARDFVSRSAAAEEPFFLMVAPFVPHKPSTPAPRHAKLFAGVKAPRTKSFNEKDISDKPSLRQRARLTAGDIGRIDVLYRQRLRSLQSVDELVAGLIDTLRESGQLSNTYVVFTSDNGFHMGQHRMVAGKYTPYEEDVHVPLLVRGPGIRPGREIDALAVSVDLPATLAELGGTSLPVPADGRSLVRLLRGARTPAGWRKSILLEQFEFHEEPQATATTLEPSDVPGGQEVPTHLGLRTATFKYVEYGTGEREYYDLVEDPAELQNLAGALKPEVQQRLSEIVEALSTCAGTGCRSVERAALPKNPTP